MSPPAAQASLAQTLRATWRRAGGRRQVGRAVARRAAGVVRSRLLGPRSPTEILADVTTPRNVVTLEAVRVVVTLGVPDLVAGGVSRVDELASRCGADPGALQRVLRHLVDRGLYVEPEPGRVVPTEAGRLLESAHPASRNAAYQLGTQPFEKAIKEMLYSVRTGEPTFERANGATPWVLMARDAKLAASFDNDMSLHARAVGPGIVAAYDWSGVSTIVDVGGGSGELLRQLLDALPGTKGSVVEYADAARRAERALASSEMAGRITVVEADFFAGVPAGGDAYVLSWVLHDWSDDQALVILRNCAEAAGPGGRVLVVERPSDVEPDSELDLRMLVFYGGRERTRVEFEQLARRSGLSVVSWTPTGAGFWIMDCRPAA